MSRYQYIFWNSSGEYKNISKLWLTWVQISLKIAKVDLRTTLAAFSIPFSSDKTNESIRVRHVVTQAFIFAACGSQSEIAILFATSVALSAR